ncbi:MAG: hypothetical protein F4045_02080 [Chloroflexi bacterium]|nr:hypothetical protein [Chloroflexota bacterium]
MSFIGLALLLVLSDKFNWSVLAANVVLFLASLPYAWLVWKLMRRNWLLLAGLMLALAVMMVYWIAALIGQSDFLTLLLLPLPVVVFGGVIWTPIASWVFNTAQERKNHRSGGPGMQALAMIVLSLPVILVAVAAPGMLELGQVWSAVSLTLVGVLLSGLIADPLRRFLLEWGNLAPGPECPEK